MAQLKAQLTEESPDIIESLEASMSAKDDQLERLSEALKIKEEAMGQAIGRLSGEEEEELQKMIEQLMMAQNCKHKEACWQARTDNTISDLEKEVEGLTTNRCSMQTDYSREKFGQAIEKLKTMQ